MTLGRNDAAVSPSFVEGLTLDGPIGHSGKVLRVLIHLILFLFFGIIFLAINFSLIVARKLAYLIRLPTDEHRLKVGVSWLTKSAIDSVALLQSTLTKVFSSS